MRRRFAMPAARNAIDEVLVREGSLLAPRFPAPLWACVGSP